MNKQPVCPQCGSEEVVTDANAVWNVDSQAWEVQIAFDSPNSCNACELIDIEFEWIKVTPERAAVSNTGPRTPAECTATVRCILEEVYDAASDGEDTALRDLLADVFHLCDASGIDFAEQQRIARDNYLSEVTS